MKENLAAGTADFYVHLGITNLQYSNYDEAVRHFRGALRLRPTDIHIMQHLAHAYYKQRDFRQALLQWHNILMMQPQNALVMFMLGRAYIGSGEVMRGQAICEQALALDGR